MNLFFKLKFINYFWSSCFCCYIIDFYCDCVDYFIVFSFGYCYGVVYLSGDCCFAYFSASFVDFVTYFTINYLAFNFSFDKAFSFSFIEVFDFDSGVCWLLNVHLSLSFYSNQKILLNIFFSLKFICYQIQKRHHQFHHHRLHLQIQILFGKFSLLKQQLQLFELKFIGDFPL